MMFSVRLVSRRGLIINQHQQFVFGNRNNKHNQHHYYSLSSLQRIILRHSPASTNQQEGIKFFSSSVSSSSLTKSSKNGTKTNNYFVEAALALCFATIVAIPFYNFQEEAEETNPLYLKRKSETPRSDWKEKCAKIGFPFANYPGVAYGSGVWTGQTYPYWNERASYHVHPYGRWQLEQAAFDIHSMCLEAAGDVIQSDYLLERFEIPRELWGAVRQSWKIRQPDIAGRLDLLWDGTNPPKLAEYNADTPTVLIESSVAQEDWFRDVYGKKGEGEQEKKRLNNLGEFSQFNVISSAMEEAFRRFKQQNPNASIIFTTNRPSAESDFLEERSTTEYMQARAKQAGVPTQFVDIEEFDDPVLYETILKAASSNDRTSKGGTLLLWKLYPYEWLVQEKLGNLLTSPDFLHGNLRWSEPPWKLILSSKAMLAYLWEKYPNHPNLLPTYWDFDIVRKLKSKEAIIKSMTTSEWVAKPRFGREGTGIMYSEDYETWSDFVDAVAMASPLQDLSSFTRSKPLWSGQNRWVPPASPGGGSIISSLSGDNIGITSSPKALFRFLEPYLGKFDKIAIDTALREREWGCKHSKEDSPMSGYFLGKPIFQQYYRPALLQGLTVVTSAWIVNGLPVGICFREDLAKTTNDDSCFVPHVVTREGSTAPNSNINFEYPVRPKAKRLREEFYGTIPVGNGVNKEPITYNEYKNTHSRGPMGYSSTGGGGASSRNNNNAAGEAIVRWFSSLYRKTRGNNTTWEKDKKAGKGKASGSAGQKSSHSANQKTQRQGRYRTGTTARGVSGIGRSGKS